MLASCDQDGADAPLFRFPAHPITSSPQTLPFPSVLPSHIKELTAAGFVEPATDQHQTFLSMRDDLNTVTLSGTLVGDSRTYQMEDMPVTQLAVSVCGAGEDGRPATFKVVAYDDAADHSRGFKAGDRVVLSGPLRQKRDGRIRSVIEIEAKVLIKMRPELLDHAAKE